MNPLASSHLVKGSSSFAKSRKICICISFNTFIKRSSRSSMIYSSLYLKESSHYDIVSITPLRGGGFSPPIRLPCNRISHLKSKPKNVNFELDFFVFRLFVLPTFHVATSVLFLGFLSHFLDYDYIILHLKCSCKCFFANC